MLSGYLDVFCNAHISGAMPPGQQPPVAKPQGSLLGGPPGMIPRPPMGPMAGPVGPMMGMPAPMGMLPPGLFSVLFSPLYVVSLMSFCVLPSI